MKIYVLTRQFKDAPKPMLSVHLDVLKKQMKQEYNDKINDHPTVYKKHGIKLTHRIGKMSASVCVEMIPQEHFLWQIDEVELSRGDMYSISSVYEDILLEERVTGKLKHEYGIDDVSKHGDIVERIISSYHHSMQNGCDDEYAFDNAFEDLRDAIREESGQDD